MATIADIKRLNPELEGLDDDQIVAAVAQSSGMSVPEVAQKVGRSTFNNFDKFRAMNPEYIDKGDDEIVKVVANQTGSSPEDVVARMKQDRLLKAYSQDELEKMGRDGRNQEARLQGLVLGRQRSALSTGLDAAADSASGGLIGWLRRNTPEALGGESELETEFRRGLVPSSRLANPKSALAGDIAGAVAQGVAAAPAGAGSLAGRLANAAVVSGADEGIRTAVNGGSAGDVLDKAAKAALVGGIGGAVGEGVAKVGGRVIDAVRMTPAERAIADAAAKDGITKAVQGEALIDAGGDRVLDLARRAASAADDDAARIFEARRRAAGGNIADSYDAAAGVAGRDYEGASKAVIDPLERARKAAFADAESAFPGQLGFDHPDPRIGQVMELKPVQDAIERSAKRNATDVFRGDMSVEDLPFWSLVGANNDLRNQAAKIYESAAPNIPEAQNLTKLADSVKELLRYNTIGASDDAFAKGTIVHRAGEARSSARGMGQRPGGVDGQSIAKLEDVVQSAGARDTGGIGLAEGVRDAVSRGRSGVAPFQTDSASAIRSILYPDTSGIDKSIAREASREARDASVKKGADDKNMLWELTKGAGKVALPAAAGLGFGGLNSQGGVMGTVGAGAGLAALGAKGLRNRSIRKSAPTVLEQLYKEGADIQRRADTQKAAQASNIVLRSIFDSLSQ